MADVVWLVLAAIAVVMALIDAVILKWASEAKTYLNAAVVLFLAFMMVAMLFGAFLYFLSPSPARLTLGLWTASAAMSISVLPLVSVVVSESARQMREGSAFVARRMRRPWLFGAAIVATVVANEFLMGATFNLAAGAAAPSLFGDPVAFLTFSVNSVWFLLPMALEMAAAAVLLSDRIPRGVWVLLLTQSSLMVLSPPISSNPIWVAAAVFAGSALMIGIIVYVMEFVYRHRQLAPAVQWYIPALLGIYALMMLGLFEWLNGNGGFLFALSVLAEMIVFFDALVHVDRFRASPGPPWQLNPHWAFALLFTIFVGELFMGAVLDLQAQPAFYVGAIPAAPLAGSVATIATNAFENGFYFVALVTGSTWFLAMMGVEMGALVVFKMRESKGREQRARYVLMLGSYAAFATFFPSAYYSQAFPRLSSGTSVPVLGWSMGIGSAPLGPSVFGVLLVTYAIVGALAILFGRRVVCSVFCTAPLMYQGTTIDEMKSFNRSSSIGHKYLGSRFSSAYTATNGVVMGSLLVASTISYLDQIGKLNITWFDSDPTVFLFALYFGVLWYLMFFLIPYTGNYNCVTMGWCYTGTFAQAFHRLGFSKLKVKDKEVCRACSTLDCAKACPVGLVDMPGHFRTRGEFRSSKCCGVGECAESCPYGNLYLYDVRHWVRSRLGRAEITEPLHPLPMISSRPASAVKAGVVPAGPLASPLDSPPA